MNKTTKAEVEDFIIKKLKAINVGKPTEIAFQKIKFPNAVGYSVNLSYPDFNLFGNVIPDLSGKLFFNLDRDSDRASYGSSDEDVLKAIALSKKHYKKREIFMSNNEVQASKRSDRDGKPDRSDRKTAIATKRFS